MVVVFTAHHPVGIVSYGISEQGSQEVPRDEASIRKVCTPQLTSQALDVMGKQSSKQESTT